MAVVAGFMLPTLACVMPACRLDQQLTHSWNDPTPCAEHGASCCPVLLRLMRACDDGSALWYARLLGPSDMITAQPEWMRPQLLCKATGASAVYCFVLNRRTSSWDPLRHTAGPDQFEAERPSAAEERLDPRQHAASPVATASPALLARVANAPPGTLSVRVMSLGSGPDDECRVAVDWAMNAIVADLPQIPADVLLRSARPNDADQQPASVASALNVQNSLMLRHLIAMRSQTAAPRRAPAPKKRAGGSSSLPVAPGSEEGTERDSPCGGAATKTPAGSSARRRRSGASAPASSPIGSSPPPTPMSPAPPPTPCRSPADYESDASMSATDQTPTTINLETVATDIIPDDILRMLPLYHR